MQPVELEDTHPVVAKRRGPIHRITAMRPTPGIYAYPGSAALSPEEQGDPEQGPEQQSFVEEGDAGK